MLDMDALASIIPASYIILAGAAIYLKRQRKTNLNGYAPLNDDGPFMDERPDSEDQHAEYQSGRIPWLDKLTVAACLVMVIRTVVDLSLHLEQGWKKACPDGAAIIGWIIASYIAMRSAKISKDFSIYHQPLWLFFALCFAGEMHRFLHMSKQVLPSDGITGEFVWGHISFATVTLLVATDSYQRFRQDCYGGRTITDSRPPWPEFDSSRISRMFFFWLDRLIVLGNRQPLQDDNLYDLAPQDSSATIINKFQFIQKKYPQKPLHVHLFHLIKYTWAYQLMCAVAFSTLSLAGPLFLNLIVGWISNPQKSTTMGWILILGMFFSSVSRPLFAAQLFHTGRRVTLLVKSSLIDAIYRKSLRKTTGGQPGGGDAGSDQSSTGKTVTLMSVDMSRLEMVFSYSHRFVIELPLLGSLAILGLFYTVGWAALAGVTVIAISCLLGTVLGQEVAKVQDVLMSATDRRVSVTNEMFRGIRIIKYFAWEPRFEDRVSQVREAELTRLRSFYYRFIGFSGMSFASSVLVTFSTFLCYTYVGGHTLDARTAFTSIALLQQIANMLSEVPWLMMELAQASVSFKRIKDFLCEEELKKFTMDKEETDDKKVGFEHATFVHYGSDEGKDIAGTQVAEEANDENAPLMNTATVEYGAVSEPEVNVKGSIFRLKDLDISLPVGELTLVAGGTGAGKSSFLLALLGELKPIAGKTYFPCKSTAYVPQTPWLINATIRDNILFGTPYDKARYQEVIECCALLRDFEILEGGDLTEVGEGGVNLSGGQKARISLARAAYSFAQTVLLDDVLAAVDAPTAKHLFNKCILGWMNGRTRILVSHHVGLCAPKADYVVYMNAGEIVARGLPAEVVKDPRAEGVHKVNLHIQDMDDTIDAEIDEPDIPIPNAASKEGEGTTLVEDEERATGNVKAYVYWAYIRACGGLGALFCFTVCLIVANFSQVANDWWLKQWADAGVEEAHFVSHHIGALKTEGMYLWRSSPWRLTNHAQSIVNTREAVTAPDTLYYMTVYGLLGLLLIASSAILSAYNILVGMRASRRLHNDLLKAILRSPLRFFEITPLGRILNRFSKDLKHIDTELSWTIFAFLQQVIKGIYTLGVVGWVSPFFLVAMMPISLIYKAIAARYLNVSRELKRLESISRSPIFNQFSETLAGVTTIRAFHAENRFSAQQRDNVDANHRAYFLLWASNRWLCLRTDLIGSVVMLGCGIGLIVRDVEPGWAGLSLAYALGLSEALLWVIRMHAELEMGMNSVERVLEYTNVESEPPRYIEDHRPPSSWPSHGHVKARNLSIAYAPGLPDVLKNLDFEIPGGFKVGVVGRTGAGKSTLSLAFFRILPYTSGTIEVDGVDIGRLGVADVRERFTIIPQDPVLFEGSIRSNLDPFDEFSDAEVWKVLERVHILDSIASEDGTNVLESTVTENGQNFSQGQRQLLCLARALLRKTKVVFLDEATASVDYETERKIQLALHECFEGATVLCIAHRLRTVMDYDMIIVLSAGKVIETGSPLELSARVNGEFSKMLDETGEREDLLNIARISKEHSRNL
ncbi:hypothetical protein HDU85_003477 [Gaertneriomyces sp. JEL0708]|nr:hypothetical protein HDU85_003477 [Gaertneriomyces sp. JEL0708]